MADAEWLASDAGKAAATKVAKAHPGGYLAGKLGCPECGNDFLIVGYQTPEAQTQEHRIADLERTNAQLHVSSRQAAVQLGETIDERNALAAQVAALHQALVLVRCSALATVEHFRELTGVDEANVPAAAARYLAADVYTANALLIGGRWDAGIAVRAEDDYRRARGNDSR